MLQSIHPRYFNSVIGGAKVVITQDLIKASETIELKNPDRNGHYHGCVRINNEKFQFFYDGRKISLRGTLNFYWGFIPYGSSLPEGLVLQAEQKKGSNTLEISYIIA